MPTEMTRDAGHPITPKPDAGSSEGPGYTPSFESAECQFKTPSDYTVECGYLTVPENRSQPEGASIRLHVAIFKSTNPNPASDPVIHLEGGPGGSSLDSASVYLKAGGDEFLATRDYVMFNQRGTRYSVPSLECPGYTEMMWEMARQGLSREAQQERETEFLLDCQNDLLDQGINLAAYNSAANAADVRDLRIALGYEQVNLYGISYGTRLALTVMRDTSDGIRSVIIDSVYPPQVNLYSQTPANAARAFEMVFADCAAEADCNRTYPDLERTFYRVIDELNANPQRVTLSHGSVTIDGDNFMDLIFGALYRKDAIPWVPAMIHSVDRGNLAALSSALEELFEYGRDVSVGMAYSLQCREEVPFESGQETGASSLDLPTQILDHFAAPFVFDICAVWKSGVANPIENQPVVSDIPTLVLAGGYDPITPPAWGRLAAETLSNSFFYEFPGVGHDVIHSHGCALEIGLQFLDDPTIKPDASCLGGLSDPDFK